MNNKNKEPLAVVGIGCRLPGGVTSPDGLWEMLLNKTDCIVDVPEERWDVDVFYDPDPNKAGRIKSRQGGFIKGVDKFDAEFFGYFAEEAAQLDPQQRMVLEVACEALEDAGQTLEAVNGSKTCVFISGFLYDHLCMQLSSSQRDIINPYAAMGVGVCSLANRLSYCLNLKGPSVAVDTACSGSLVALHMACRSIWSGESEAALAGGVNALLKPESSVVMSQAGFLSPDARCKAFDESANGYVRSEGAGIVYLKRLSQALEDNDLIYGVIRGTAVNSDGYTSAGFTVPDKTAQVKMLRAAYDDAGVDPMAVAYVEAHGPGTPVGDPIEAAALGEVIGKGRAEDEAFPVGSIKTNIGHLEGASGIAGFIKASVALKKRGVPPNLHFHRPNPAIPFREHRIVIPTELMPMVKKHASPPLVGVNSFGAGGTNAHVVMQGVEQRFAEQNHVVPNGWYVFVISAKTERALKDYAEKYIAYLSGETPPLIDISLAQFTRRTRHPHQLFVIAANKGDYIASLKRFINDESSDNAFYYRQARLAQARVAFVFSGQGGQWAQMGVALMKSEPVFEKAMLEFDACFKALSGWSIIDELIKPEAESVLNETTVVQPAIAAVQIAMTTLMRHYGLRPDAVVGHSIGEVAAAYASGALDLGQAAFVIYHRARIQDKASGKGRMLALAVSEEEGRRLAAPYAERISIATINSYDMITLAGEEQPLNAIAAQMEARGIFTRFVNVKVPYHSHYMTPLRDELTGTLAECEAQPVKVPLYSTVTTQRQNGEGLTGDYWYRNVREPVRFAQTIERMVDDGYEVYIEIGPHPVLSVGMEAILKAKGGKGVVATTMNRKQPDSVYSFFAALTAWLSTGSNPEGIEGKSVMVKLPAYPWQKQRYWYESREERSRRLTHQPYPFVKGLCSFVTNDSLKQWDVGISLGAMPYLADHTVDGAVVYPAAAHIMMAFAAGREMYGHDEIYLHDMRFENALIVPDEKNSALNARLEVVDDEGAYTICTRNADAESDIPWSKHSHGKINYLRDTFVSRAPDLTAVKGDFLTQHRVDVADFYRTIGRSGLQYGTTFQCIKEMWIRGSEVLARIDLDMSLEYEAHRYLIHPTVFDAHLQMTFADQHVNGNPDSVYLPNTIDAVKVSGTATRCMWAYVSVTQNDDTWLCSDHFLYDDRMQLVSELHGMAAKCLPSGIGVEELARDGVAEYLWMHAGFDSDEACPATVEGELLHVIVLADDGHGEKLANAVRQVRPEVNVAVLDEVEGVPAALADATHDRRTHIIYAPGGMPDEIDSSVCGFYEKALVLMQALVEAEAICNLFIVTETATTVAEDSEVNLLHAPLFAMARVFRNEYPNLMVRVIDIEGWAKVPVERLTAEILRNDVKNYESEVAIRAGERFIRKLEFVDAERVIDTNSVTVSACGSGYTAEFDKTGVIGDVAFRCMPYREVDAGQIEIHVKASAVNYKDVMNVMGLLSKRSVDGGLAADRLGLEVAGVVASVGEGVNDFRPGDEVVARVTHGFSGRCVTTPAYVARKPQNYSFEEAAAVPVVYLTAHYGLNYLGRMEAGETVLIHSAAGGVGIAAIRLARAAGAKIIATAGSRKKRTQLRKMFGIEHVFDSRANAFYSEVMALTDGRGVDLVLNSLTGKQITQSLKCLAPYGRFIEIGKTDIYGNTSISLERLGENISYHVVDVDRLAAQKPALHKRLLDEVIEIIERKEIAAHPIIDFPVTELDKALRQMTRAAHIGKFVVTMQGSVKCLPVKRYQAPEEGAIVITGGTGGLGLRLADWLSVRGAGQLVLMSRSGIRSEEEQGIVDAIIARGTRVMIEKGDVVRREDVARVIEQAVGCAGKVSGVVHAAGVLKDALVPNMTKENFALVFNPKAVGAFNLHQACADAGQCPELFLMISSMSSVLGLKGQINYASANYFEDALAEHRQTMGLPATSVNLGVLGEYAGMSMKAKDDTGVLDLLDSSGLGSMHKIDVFAKIEAAILDGGFHRLCAKIHWDAFGTAYPNLRRDTRFEDVFNAYALRRGERRKKGANLRDALHETAAEQRHAFLTRKVAAAISELTGMPPSSVSTDEPIDKWALDSIMLGQIAAWILKNTEINYPLIKLVKGPTLEEIAAELLSQMQHGESDSSVTSGHVGDKDDGSLLLDMGAEALSKWVIRGCSKGNEKRRVICFHSMGVGASLFTHFLLNPPPGTDMLAIQSPGRENRKNEPFIRSVDEIVDHVVREIRPYLDDDYIIWGHSFGGIVAFETIRRLRDEGLKLPYHLMLTATIAPDLVKVWQNRDVLLRVLIEENRAEYLIALSRYIEDPEFIERILPVMRRDMPMLQTYSYREGEKLDIPITAWAAHQDDVVYFDEVERWEKYTDKHFNLYEVDGDHWFLNSNKSEILHRLEAILNGEGDE